MGQQATPWEVKMKRTVYGGEVGTENDNMGSQRPNTRREVTGKGRVISSILGCQREATTSDFESKFLKDKYLSGG